MNKALSYSELQNCIDILEDLNDKKKLSYSDLVKNLLENFSIKISVKELQEYFEPTVEELQEDLEIQYRNVL